MSRRLVKNDRLEFSTKTFFPKAKQKPYKSLWLI
jgi:hypothetical protein